ncbi:MAG: hypothetical protein H0V70_14250 [Ktedonobacteraceae bacterium]|nr:hypothetical protein [Ktedonobacteraceae bacterium]
MAVQFFSQFLWLCLFIIFFSRPDNEVCVRETVLVLL